MGGGRSRGGSSGGASGASVTGSAGLALLLLAACHRSPPGEIGVDDCDAYITRMSKCLDRMQPTARAAASISLQHDREAWKDNGRTEEGRKALEQTCRVQLSALRTNPSCPQ